jgi:hypothetical protein
MQQPLMVLRPIGSAAADGVVGAANPAAACLLYSKVTHHSNASFPAVNFQERKQRHPNIAQ